MATMYSYDACYQESLAFGQEYGYDYAAGYYVGDTSSGDYVGDTSSYYGYSTDCGYNNGGAEMGYDHSDGQDHSRHVTANFFQKSRRTPMCKFFLQGKCTRGDACNYSHGGPSRVAKLNLDDFSDFSDSESDEDTDQDVSDDKAERNEKLLLPVASNFQEADLEPAAEPSPSAVQEEKKVDTAILPGEKEEAGSGNASEPEAEELPETRNSSDTPQWRQAQQRPRRKELEGLSGSETSSLQISPNSWAARHRQKRDTTGQDDLPSDESVARSVKSILNKLTIEKFASLFKQLVGCGLRKPCHVELLIREVFEKATMQHHFIDMYADLCVLLHEYFTAHPLELEEGKAISFKRLLLDECQASFERLINQTQEQTGRAKGEDGDEEAASRHKTHMLGNIKLVGTLLSRSMLAGKVGIAILEELLSSPTPEALESVAILLTIAGPTFDRPDSKFAKTVVHIFDRITQLARGKECKPRERFLLADLLELRANKYVSRHVKKAEQPTTLEQVKKEAAKQRLIK